jgi:5'-3' exonuclease
MKCNLVVDTNFLLNRNAFALDKEKTLYGDLLKSLITTIELYERQYHYKNVFIVCDAKTSWRKMIYADYKGTRKKDENMDWEFIFNTYEQFKQEIKESGRYILLEGDHLEGDDWVSYIVKESNKQNESCVIIASDVDLNQTLAMSLSPLWINVQVKDIFKHEKVFFPENYRLFISKLKQEKNSLFKLNEAPIFHQFLNELTNRRKIEETSPQAVIFKKLISGDTGDNIKSIIFSRNINPKTGKETIRGIGDKGAEKIYAEYMNTYPELIDFTSKIFAKRIIAMVKKFKKDTTTDNNIILERLFLNLRLVHLDTRYMPENTKFILTEKYNQTRKV